MDDFKLDNFLKETGNVFAEIETLTVSERSEVMTDLLKQGKLPNESSNLFIAFRESLLEANFTSDETYNLQRIFDSLDFEVKGDVYLIWDDKSIDRIAISALVSNWQHIWYGIADDVVILYHSISKQILLITHYGSVFHN